MLAQQSGGPILQHNCRVLHLFRAYPGPSTRLFVQEFLHPIPCSHRARYPTTKGQSWLTSSCVPNNWKVRCRRSVFAAVPRQSSGERKRCAISFGFCREEQLQRAPLSGRWSILPMCRGIDCALLFVISTEMSGRSKRRFFGLESQACQRSLSSAASLASPSRWQPNQWLGMRCC